jgi:hypothetical protein
MAQWNVLYKKIECYFMYSNWKNYALKWSDVTCLYRAQAVNPHIGREEYSSYVRLTVTGEPPTEIAPEIIIKPTDMQIVKEAGVDLHCIANARYWVY